jgi:UMF1 family MFS transporter
MADFSASKKRFLLFFAYTGSLFTILLYFCHSGDVVRTLLFFLITQISFVNGNVFYDAFLPHIASDDKMDDVSAKGYAYGYIGGGLQFAIALALVSLHDKLGLSRELAARIGIATSGIWWGAFTIFTARFVPEAKSAAELPPRYASMPRNLGVAALGVERTWQTARKASKFPHLLLFLLAFMLYNEGVQTVINMASIYGTSELKLDASALMLTLLIIQFVAMGGSLIFSRLADKVGTKKAIVTALILWMGVVIYAYYLKTTVEYFILGMIVGIAMGGVQSLSRSYYGSMIPEEASAEFFGFYTVFTKFSAIWGPWTFAFITHWAGSARTAILALITYFIAGTLLLLIVNEAKARQAREAAIF